MLPSAGIGPLNALIATSIIMNAVITGILQVYISQLPESESESESPPPIGTGGNPLPPT
jgi:hypothetical protein